MKNGLESSMQAIGTILPKRSIGRSVKPHYHAMPYKFQPVTRFAFYLPDFDVVIALVTTSLARSRAMSHLAWRDGTALVSA